MNKKLKTFLNILLDVLIVFFLLFSATTLVISLSQKAETPDGGPSNLFGYSIRSVVSDSMEPYNEKGEKYEAENGFYKGDLIICEVTDEDDTYSIGDTVMFWMPLNSNRQQCSNTIYTTMELTTHEIVRTEQLEDGTVLYYTQGLNRQPGKNLTEDLLPKTADEFVAKYNGKRIGGVGSVFTFIKGGFSALNNTGTDGWGFFLCIILPIAIFAIIQAVRVIRNFIAFKAQKAATQAASGELSEEQKRLIAEEYLKQQKAAEDDATSSTVESTADGE